MLTVLALNSGSSSIKFALYKSVTFSLSLVCRGEIKGIPYRLHFKVYEDKNLIKDDLIEKEANFENALSSLLEWIQTRYSRMELKAAGHRIVHGGMKFKKSVRLDKEALGYLETLTPLAPLHQSHNLEGVKILQKLYPDLPQVGCFDTAFHHTQPKLATLFGLPHSYWEEGVRRYGFHGISYRYIAETLVSTVGEKGKGRVIVAHLGHGASLCALKNLKSIATTMGFTTLEGLPMGTRCGSIDPGVLLYLQSSRGYPLEQVTRLLYQDSGLLGVSGVSEDMQALLKSHDPLAKLAIDYFCYRIQREIGSLVAALGGVNGIVFTGGIGENAHQIREKVCAGLSWLDISINQKENKKEHGGTAVKLTKQKHSPFAWVMPTDEEIVIALDTVSLL